MKIQALTLASLTLASSDPRFLLTLASLSMGMTADMVGAILEGATVVRVGTAIFGARPSGKP
jgi:uncharacterized pyridoxal phosphate-containing UPF0001 family protein